MTSSQTNLISIGGMVPSSEPLGLLTDCHRRIEAALGVLAAAAHWPDTLEAAQRRALDAALRFFREMAPKHTADEEQSLFPRMRRLGIDPPELRALEADHLQADAWHREVGQLGEIRLTSVWTTPQRERYAGVITALGALYQRHIEVEDHVVFPAAKRLLPVEQQEQVRREMVGRRAIRWAALALGTLLLPWPAEAQAAGMKPVHLGPVTVQGSIRTRLENWDWFSNGQGEEAYAFSGTVARISFSQSRKPLDWQLEFAAPVLLGLPDQATPAAPVGPLGLGGNYFSANHNHRHAAMVFLKQGNLRFKSLFGDERQSIKVGRFEFNDGTEVAPKDATLAALKRDRITQRLIGTFVWTHVQRSFDGFHYVANGKVSLHVLGALPTRGVFQVDGWGPLRTGFVYISANRAQANSDWRLFGIYYHDWRNVLKTDNRPVLERRADLTSDIRIGTYGGHFLHKVPLQKAGAFDLLLWGAAQRGTWGRLSHRAAAGAAEIGWQPAGAVRFKPWLRGGYYYGSGDGNAADGRHGTFFQNLPTPRPYARFPFFNMMNNQDVHGALILRPSPKVTVKTEVHALRLASAADQWLLGGGAFQPWSFGYIGRPSGVATGRPGLANLYDVSGDWNASAHVTLSAYYGHAQGLRVVESTYPKGKHGNFGYLEFTYRF